MAGRMSRRPAVPNGWLPDSAPAGTRRDLVARALPRLPPRPGTTRDSTPPNAPSPCNAPATASGSSPVQTQGLPRHTTPLALLRRSRRSRDRAFVPRFSSTPLVSLVAQSDPQLFYGVDLDPPQNRARTFPGQIDYFAV